MTCTDRTFADVLGTILSYSEDSAFEKGAYVIPMFSAEAPEMRREHDLLVLFYQCDGGKILLRGRNEPRAVQMECVNSVAGMLLKRYMVSERDAKYVCEQFWYAITGKGIDICISDLPTADIEKCSAMDQDLSASGKNHLLPSSKGKRIWIPAIFVVAVVGLFWIIGTGSTASEEPEGYEDLAANMSYDEIYDRGDDYFNGDGVEQNYAEAIKWYLAGAEKGDPAAQTQLGYIYLNGYGVDVNYKEAFKWYSAGAEQGYSRAQHSVGWMYEEGYGVGKSYSQAVYWYRLAAEQGQQESEYALGNLYEEGYGVSQSYEEALMWYKRSAERGYSLAQGVLGSMYYYGVGVDQDYEESYYWFRLAAEQGETVSQKHLGMMFEHGYGVEQDLTEAEKWYALAAESAQ